VGHAPQFLGQPREPLLDRVKLGLDRLARLRQIPRDAVQIHCDDGKPLVQVVMQLAGKGFPLFFISDEKPLRERPEPVRALL
jgi:hypothetical protein